MYVVKMIIIAVLALLTIAEGNPLEDRYRYQRICEQNGANYTVVEGAAGKLIECMMSDFGIQNLETEVKSAYLSKNYGTLNSVIKQYCLKSSVLKNCYNKFMETASTCLGSDKQEFVQANTNLNYQYLDYLCEDDGHALAEFASTGGPQCLEEKTYNIRPCTEYAKLSIFNVLFKSHPSATDTYQVYDEFLKCLLPSVKTCRTPIPAEIIKKLSDITQSNISKAGTSTSELGERDTTSEQGPVASTGDVNGRNGNSKPQKKLIRAFGNVTFTISGDIFV